MTHKLTTRNSQATDGSNSSCILSGGLTCGNYGGRKKDEKERKRLKSSNHKSLPCIPRWICALLACNKPIFELPIQQRITLQSHEVEAWVQLVTLTVKLALADSCSVPSWHQPHHHCFLTPPARPNSLTINKLVNELRPVSRLQP